MPFIRQAGSRWLTEQPHRFGLWWVDHWAVAEVQVDSQLAAISQTPARADSARPQHLSAERPGTRQVRNDVSVAQLQQLSIQRQAGLLFRCAAADQPQLRGVERLLGVGIGNLLAALWIGKCAERGEFVAPAFAHQFGEFAVVAGEKLERLLGGVLVAHEHQRNHR